MFLGTPFFPQALILSQLLFLDILPTNVLDPVTFLIGLGTALLQSNCQTEDYFSCSFAKNP